MREYIKPKTQNVLLPKDIAADCATPVISSGNVTDGFTVNSTDYVYITVPRRQNDNSGGVHYRFPVDSGCSYKFEGATGVWATCEGKNSGGRCEYNLTWYEDISINSIKVWKKCTGDSSWFCCVELEETQG